jgi:hypothetical protein
VIALKDCSHYVLLVNRRWSNAMADEQLELRVTKLERDFTHLRDQRVATLDREWANIPDLIDLRFRQTESKFARVFSELDGLKAKVDAIPRAVAEMLTESDRRGED